MERQYTNEIEPSKDRVRVSGWAHEVRDIGKLVFVILRDREGTVQITFKKDNLDDKEFDRAKDIGREDVIDVMGSVEENDEAPNGFEIKPEEFEILTEAKSPLPLEIRENIDSEMETRLDNRFMDLRKKEIHAIFSFRDKVITSLREWYDENEFLEIHTPIISKGGAEGGATLFPVEYYSNKAYLRQSPQLYKQMLMASGFDKVYEVGPSFRAEEFATSRHVSEFTQWDVELAFIDGVDDVMDVLEDSMKSLLKKMKKRGQHELGVLDEDIEVPEEDFPRITFDKARKILREEYNHVPEEKGDLDTEGEKLLGEHFQEKGHDFVFVLGYPNEKFYYMQEIEEDEAASRKFDLLYKGQEISSGGQREHRLDVLLDAMEEQDVDKSNFKFYLEAFKYGMPPHGGFGVGLDRVVTKMIELDNIKESILFPRDPDRVAP